MPLFSAGSSIAGGSTAQRRKVMRVLSSTVNRKMGQDSMIYSWAFILLITAFEYEGSTFELDIVGGPIYHISTTLQHQLRVTITCDLHGFGLVAMICLPCCLGGCSFRISRHLPRKPMYSSLPERVMPQSFTLKLTLHMVARQFNNNNTQDKKNIFTLLLFYSSVGLLGGRREVRK